MEYHRLIYNSEDESCTVVEDYNLGDFDLVKFWRQGNLDDMDLTDLSLTISEGHPADYLPTPITIPIVSRRLMEHLLTWQKNIKFTSILPAIKKAPEGLEFYVMEFYKNYQRLVEVEESEHIVRVRKKGSGKIYLSDPCAKSFIGKGFRPVAFIKVGKDKL